jgi:uncharacterized membrane protein YfcA
LIYNVVAIPSGVWRYLVEGRMAWPLAWVVVAGTLPGVAIGAVVRVAWLPDPAAFKLFAGCVLVWIGLRLGRDLLRIGANEKAVRAERLFAERLRRARDAGEAVATAGRVKTLAFTPGRITYEFYGEVFSFSTVGIFALAFVVGIVGGTYGIGGGAIIAPFLVSVFRLPIYTVAGAALAGTFVTSVFGVVFYQFVVPLVADPALSVAPDWPLGLLFGVGGLAGIYCGARSQKFVPARLIKAMLAVVILVLSARYIGQFWMS